MLIETSTHSDLFNREIPFVEATCDVCGHVEEARSVESLSTAWQLPPGPQPSAYCSGFCRSEAEDPVD